MMDVRSQECEVRKECEEQINFPLSGNLKRSGQ